MFKKTIIAASMIGSLLNGVSAFALANCPLVEGDYSNVDGQYRALVSCRQDDSQNMFSDIQFYENGKSQGVLTCRWTESSNYRTCESDEDMISLGQGRDDEFTNGLGWYELIRTIPVVISPVL